MPTLGGARNVGRHQHMHPPCPPNWRAQTAGARLRRCATTIHSHNTSTSVILDGSDWVLAVSLERGTSHSRETSTAAQVRPFPVLSVRLSAANHVPGCSSRGGLAPPIASTSASVHPLSQAAWRRAEQNRLCGELTSSWDVLFLSRLQHWRWRRRSTWRDVDWMLRQATIKLTDCLLSESKLGGPLAPAKKPLQSRPRHFHRRVLQDSTGAGAASPPCREKAPQEPHRKSGHSQRSCMQISFPRRSPSVPDANSFGSRQDCPQCARNTAR